MKFLPNLTLTAAALSILAAPLVHANGLGGQRLEKNVGQYIVDIGTDQEFTPQAGVPVRFDFNLLKSGNRESVSFTDVDVFITKNGKPLMDSDVIVSRFGPTFIAYTFPESGPYDLETTFFDKDKRLADAVFTLTIGGPPSGDGSAGGSSRSLIFGIILGIIPGIIIGALVSKRFSGGRPA